MRGILLIILLLSSGMLFAQLEKQLPEAPKPQKLVVDQTGTLTSDQLTALEKKLVAYDDSTSNQIAVVIIASTGDYDIADFAFALGRKWGIGSKDFNNGVLVLIAKNDRAVFIATGYGLEGAIPDILAKQIVEDEIVPNFRGNDFYRGIDEGTDAIMKAAAGEYKVKQANRKKGKKFPYGLVILLIIYIIITINRNRNGGGGFMSRRGYRGMDMPFPFFPTGGSRGGDSGGGFGGFGGFGGGSFGGGGAGGRW